MRRLLPVLLAALGLLGCHHSSSLPPSVRLEGGPVQPLVVEPGARSIVLLAFAVHGIGAGGTVETLQLRVRTAGSVPPVRGLRLVEDRNRNHSFDPDDDACLADVDGDGDLDAAIANGGAQVNRLFLNDGRGQFQEAPVGVFRPALGGGAHVVFGDVDGNGRPDLLATHFWGDNHLYFADSGRLAERPGMLPNSPGGFAGAVFTDIDGDLDLDLVLAAFWGGSGILLNPRRDK